MLLVPSRQLKYSPTWCWQLIVLLSLAAYRCNWQMAKTSNWFLHFECITFRTHYALTSGSVDLRTGLICLNKSWCLFFEIFLSSSLDIYESEVATLWNICLNCSWLCTLSFNALWYLSNAIFCCSFNAEVIINITYWPSFYNNWLAQSKHDQLLIRTEICLE